MLVFYFTLAVYSRNFAHIKIKKMCDSFSKTLNLKQIFIKYVVIS